MEKRVRKKPQEKRRLLAIDLKYIQLCQKKVFCRTRNSESSCARKATTDMGSYNM